MWGSEDVLMVDVFGGGTLAKIVSVKATKFVASRSCVGVRMLVIEK